MVRVPDWTRAASSGVKSAGRVALDRSLLQHTNGAPAEGPEGRVAVWSSAHVFAGEDGSPSSANAPGAFAPF